MKLAAIGGILLLGGAIAALTGLIPADEVWAIAERTWPILLFVVAITVVANLTATAGVFDLAAAFLGTASRGRTAALWLLVVLLAVASTAFLSLDTTAVLLTPVVVRVARAHGLPPLPFALSTVWLANTASLWLPVSNLTNLLAEHRLGSVGPAGFVQLVGPSALVATLVTVAALAVINRRDLRGRFGPAEPPRVADRRFVAFVAAVVVLLLPLLVSGVAPWIPASAAALVLVAAFAWRSPRSLRWTMVPWQLVVFAGGLFLAVGAVRSLTGGALLTAIAGSGDDLFALWRLAGTGMLGANAIDNLPAYLVLEDVADSPARLAALLVGVNAGALITPWAALSTLLWHQQLSREGISVGWGRYALLGLCGAPLIVALAVVPLALRP